MGFSSIQDQTLGPPTSQFQAFRSHAPGRSAHHSGWREIALTPRCLNRYATSCKRGNAVPTFPPGPDQKTWADALSVG